MFIRRYCHQPLRSTRVWRKNFSKSIHNLDVVTFGKTIIFVTGHVALIYHRNKYKPDKISKTCPTALHWRKLPIFILDSVQNDLRLRSGRCFLHFRYHEVYQCGQASKHRHRMARLAPGHADLLLQHYLDCIINLHGVSKGRNPTCPLRTYSSKKNVIDCEKILERFTLCSPSFCFIDICKYIFSRLVCTGRKLEFGTQKLLNYDNS